MGRYLIKTQMRVFEAENSAQLARLAVLGLIARDALIRDAEDGRWTRAEEHPDIGRLYGQHEDNERTVIAALVPELQAVPPAPVEEEQVLWVRTDTSTVEVRGFSVLLRLFELGVVRKGHQVASSPAGPFVALEGRPNKGALAALLGSVVLAVPATPSTPKLSNGSELLVGQRAELFARMLPHREPGTDDPFGVTTILRPGAGRVLERDAVERPSDDPSSRTSITQDPESSWSRKESSVVVTLRDIESNSPRRREVSNVVLLSAADIELLDDADVHIEEEVILLSSEDIEEFESINEARPVPSFASPWEEFRKAMNLAASRLSPQELQRENTWDLFRGMMKRRPDGRNGPSEDSWKRFKLRLGRSATPAPARAETTWDRFRQIMASSELVAETTWDRFVRNIQQRSATFSGPLKGEAIIKSGVIHVAELDKPSVEVYGLGDD